jgi:hypothetical protein
MLQKEDNARELPSKAKSNRRISKKMKKRLKIQVQNTGSKSNKNLSLSLGSTGTVVAYAEVKKQKGNPNQFSNPIEGRIAGSQECS